MLYAVPGINLTAMALKEARSRTPLIFIAKVKGRLVATVYCIRTSPPHPARQLRLRVGCGVFDKNTPHMGLKVPTGKPEEPYYNYGQEKVLPEYY
jgi:hypothetical protein